MKFNELYPPGPAIPTTYNGCNFRSRLEAKWAAFFDLNKWNWTYEPFDLEGYIPDFLLDAPEGKCLVEVKPREEDVPRAMEKFEGSSWKHGALVVGPVIFESPWGGGGACLGELGGQVSLPEPKWDSADSSWHWNFAGYYFCAKCSRTFFHHEVDHKVRRGDGHHLSDIPLAYAQRIFREAGNRVQWKPPVNSFNHSKP